MSLLFSDLKNADPLKVCIELSHLFDIDPETVLKVSAKVGTGIKELLDAIVSRIPPPNVDRDGLFRALLFDRFVQNEFHKQISFTL